MSVTHFIASQYVDMSDSTMADIAAGINGSELEIGSAQRFFSEVRLMASSLYASPTGNSVHGGVSEEAVEAAARALCVDDGRHDPDELDRMFICDDDNNPLPAWRWYEDAARAALTAASVQQGKAGWQPIETAPKDGTRIFVAEVTEEYTNVMEARWCTFYAPNDRDAPAIGGLMTGWWGLSWRVGDSEWPGVKDQRERSPFGRADNSALRPTHWQPLPTPPSIPGDGR